jgi:hypothetical protein
MNYIDHIYYINLDYRTDRRLQMEDWLEETQVPMEKVTRITGIPTPGKGIIGCGQGHIKALEAFLNSTHTNCIIFEDDYMPLDTGSFWSSIERAFNDNITFDVLMCSYNELKSEPGPKEYLRKVLFSFTASGYIITRDFAVKLRDNLVEGNRKLIEAELEGKPSGDFFNDVYWMNLMPTSNWYCFYPRIGKQRDSYSDIQQICVSYVG